MARGKLEKTKLKEAVVTAVRETTAYQVAGQILEQSKTKAQEKKSLTESFKEHFGKWLDRVDPIELAAIVAATYVIHETITGTAELYNRIVAFSKTKEGTLTKPLVDFFSIAFGQTNILNDASAQAFDITENDFLTWIVSFIIAYIGIKNAAKIGSSILSIGAIMGTLGL